MKIKELIEQLQKCNPEAEAIIMDIEGNYDTDVLQVEDNDEQVFLYAEL